MGRRELFALGCIAALLAGCNGTDGDKKSCDVQTYKATCEGNSVLRCINGEIAASECSLGCENGVCRTTPAESCSPDGAKQCNGKQPQICANGAWQNNGAACEVSCENGVCAAAPAADCSPDGAKQCSGKQPQICANGTWQNNGAACEDSCENGVCAATPAADCSPDGAKQCNGKQPQICANGAWQNDGAACAGYCANGVCETDAPACGDGGAVCDKSNFGGKTCDDYVDVPAKATVSGTLSCSDDCTIDSSKCGYTFCGNNNLDIYEGEFCDVVDGNVEFYSSSEQKCEDLNAPNCGEAGQPTCYEYEEGGLPGCSADCKSISKGTCKIKAQPMDGIKTCEFSSLSFDETTRELSANASVVIDEGLGQTSVTGQLVCAANADIPTYKWNLGRSDARHLDCEDCVDDEYKLIADTMLGSLPGNTYSCVFLVHVDAGQASSTMYVCPTSEGYPNVQGIVSGDYIRTFDIAETAVEGTVLAKWTFISYDGTDKTPVNSVAAESGEAAASAALKVSDGSGFIVAAGTGGATEGAASMSGLSVGSALDCKTMKHFVISLDTTGYENIRIIFAAAASGSGEMQVAVTQNTQDACTQLGAFNVPGEREFKTSPVIDAAGASDLSNARFGIYMWNDGDQNQSLRVDDIIVTGDPIVTATPAQQ